MIIIKCDMNNLFREIVADAIPFQHDLIDVNGDDLTNFMTFEKKPVYLPYKDIEGGPSNYEDPGYKARTVHIYRDQGASTYSTM